MTVTNDRNRLDVILRLRKCTDRAREAVAALEEDYTACSCEAMMPGAWGRKGSACSHEEFRAVALNATEVFLNSILLDLAVHEAAEIRRAGTVNG